MVYIDNFNAPYKMMKMCHMVADSSEELFEMAEKIGIDKKYVQNPGTPQEHFDVCLSRKAKALELGAKEITMRELGKRLMILLENQSLIYR